MSNYPNKLVSCRFTTPANPVAANSSGHTPALTTAAIFVMEWDISLPHLSTIGTSFKCISH